MSGAFRKYRETNTDQSRIRMTRQETETWDVDLTRQKTLELSLGGSLLI